MKKLVKILSAFLLCAGFVLTLSSCAFNNTMKTEEYTGKTLSYSGTYQNFSGTSIDYECELNDMSLTYYKNNTGDWFEVYYTNVITLEASSGKQVNSTPSSFGYTLYKDGKDTYIYAYKYNETASGSYDPELVRVPVEMKGNDISFKLDWYDGNLNDVNTLKFNFTKAK